MRFTAVTLFAGLAAATFPLSDWPVLGEGSWPSASASESWPAPSESAWPSAPAKVSKVTSAVALPEKSASTCATVTETCTVTVTAPPSYGTGSYSKPANSTSKAAPYVTTPAVKATPSYYVNSAPALSGSAFAIGAGVVAAFFM